MKIINLIDTLNQSNECLKEGDNVMAIILLNELKKQIKGKLDRTVDVLNNITRYIEDNEIELAYKHLTALSDAFTTEEINSELKKETD